MDKYLQQHFTGKYRVLPHLDLDTNEIPRDHNGDWDNSYADFYIKCANNIEIRHSIGSVLSCYIPTKQRGMNILKQIYQDKVDKVLPKETDSDGIKYLTNLCSKLTETDTLVSAEVLDGEVYFEFKTDMMEYIAKLVKPSTNGAKISPFSNKNLPKTKYNIPNDDMELYRQSIEHLPQREMIRNGKSFLMVDGIVIKNINAEFNKIISKKLKIKVDSDRKKKGLGQKEYIHSIGMWKEYCEFLKETNCEYN